MINLHHLRVFYMAAKYESCTAAAQKLCVTQPAITAQIRKLEDQCSLKLFKKRGRNIHLTDEGTALFHYARRIFECEREVEDAIEEMRKLKRGVLRLGTTKTYARYFMPVLISTFHETYPQIKIHLDEGSSLDMTQSLVGLKNEVVVIAMAAENPAVTFIPLSHEKLVLIMAPSHPLANKAAVSVRELAGEPIIMKEAGSGTRLKVNGLFERYGCDLNILMETSNAEFIKQLVQQGEGFSFLVKEAVATELQEKKLVSVPLMEEELYLDVSIAYLKNEHLSRPAQAFVDILLEMAQGKEPQRGLREIMARLFENWK
ncbi:MAG TPA: LysR family transcriptional regulator [Deltaproteobacteria bacterium]|nr:LysR family transcriptional regulator [Deltaproteobacteria bacterium]